MRVVKLNNAAVGRKEKANTNGKDGYPYLNKHPSIWYGLTVPAQVHLNPGQHAEACGDCSAQNYQGRTGEYNQSKSLH